MNASEWLQIAAVIADRWPHADLPDSTVQRYGDDLVDLEGPHVAAAVEVIYREGARFAPNAAQIRAKVIELALDAPAWSTVLAELRGEVVEHTQPTHPETCEFDVCDGSGWLEVDGTSELYDVEAKPCECKVAHTERVRAHRETRHALIRDFETAYGPQIADGLSGGRNGEAQVRTKWEEFCDRRHREIALKGMPDAGLPALARINRNGPKTIEQVVESMGLKQLDSGEKAAA
jgi:hypothetical protein